ncbi:histidine phosphatase family protein [bacterium]|nr:MAG: histidine phosphatase family protein [bacterium]MCL4232439.1 phosphoglycerate mutase family protein [Dehalococcoidia bacterium]
MNLYLVRHGQTAHNRDGVSLGRQDVPLTPLGEQQAAAVASALAPARPVRIYASPLRRAFDTAAAIAHGHGLEPIVRSELIELDAGEAEGLTFPELRERFGPFLAEWVGPLGHQAVMPGGESISRLEQRLLPIIPELLDPAAGDAAVVSHNFVLRVLVCRLMGLDAAAFRSVAVDVASISTFLVNGDRVVMDRLNDTCHLNSLNLDRDGRSV